MIRRLAMNVADVLNFFPAKGGVPDHYRPHIIISQRKFYYNKHLQVVFGAYVQMS